MNNREGYPWATINEFLINCGKSKSPQEFVVNVLNGIDAIVPYDQGRIYSTNANGEMSDCVLFGVDKKWPIVYSDYYSEILNGRYSLKMKHPSGSISENGVCDWTQSEDDEFVKDYIRPQGIRFSFGFGLFDMSGMYKRICILDRTCKVTFSPQEKDILSIIFSHVENMHRSYYFDTTNECFVGRIGSGRQLTSRESEIANLIQKGYTPEHIAKFLFVSRSTVYKHIAHIHAKIGVCNRQELLVKLLHYQQ